MTRKRADNGVRRLVVRADADASMGIGHVMRMIALGQAWKNRGGEVVFLSNASGALAARIRGEGFLLEASGARCDAVAVCDLAPEGGWVAVDGYHFDPAWVQSLRDAGRKVLVMDDINDRGPYRADILLNQNLGAGDCAYEMNPDGMLLAGERFVLLRREFLDAAQGRPRRGDGLKNILVSFGGGDSGNMAASVIRAVHGLNAPAWRLKVVVGPVCQHFSELKALADGASCRVEILENAEDMPGLMRWADIAVVGAGSTCWELCFLGVPMALAVVAENQRGIGRELCRVGAARMLDASDVESSLADVLGSLSDAPDALEAMAGAGQSLVDGSGAARVCEAMLPTLLSLREANESDSRRVLIWANDPVSRKMSFNTNPIDEEEHVSWFDRMLASEDSMMLVGENQWGVPVGIIRFSRNGGEVVVSVNLSPRFRGIGLGGRLISMGSNLCVAAWGLPIVAFVKACNLASVGSFVRAGYVTAEEAEVRGDHPVRLTFGGKA